MLPALLFAAMAMDPPNFAACEAVPWPTVRSELDLDVHDRPLGDFHGHEVRLRVCGEYMGFGYWSLMAVLWTSRDGGSPHTMRLSLHTTACIGSEVKRVGDDVVLETTTCAYSDDPDVPAAVTRTRLRWQPGPDRFTRVSTTQPSR